MSLGERRVGPSCGWAAAGPTSCGNLQLGQPFHPCGKNSIPILLSSDEIAGRWPLRDLVPVYRFRH